MLGNLESFTDLNETKGKRDTRNNSQASRRHAATATSASTTLKHAIKHPAFSTVTTDPLQCTLMAVRTLHILLCDFNFYRFFLCFHSFGGV